MQAAGRSPTRAANVPLARLYCVALFTMVYICRKPRSGKTTGRQLEKRFLPGDGGTGAVIAGGQRAVHCGDRTDPGTPRPRLDGAHDEVVVCRRVRAAGRL